MIEVLKKDQPKVEAMLDAPIARRRMYARPFCTSAHPLRESLKERGGWDAVNRAYRFPPESTADILHPEGVSTIDLGPGEVVGELGWIDAREVPATAGLAMSAASGWRGDRIVEYGGARAWQVAFDGRDQAQRFRNGAGELSARQAPAIARHPGPEADGEAWPDPTARSTPYLRFARPVGRSAEWGAYNVLLDHLDGPPTLAIYSRKDKKTISFGEMVDQLIDADLICLGETHDSDLCHRVQLQVIEALLCRTVGLASAWKCFSGPTRKRSTAISTAKPTKKTS